MEEREKILIKRERESKRRKLQTKQTRKQTVNMREREREREREKIGRESRIEMCNTNKRKIWNWNGKQ